MLKLPVAAVTALVSLLIANGAAAQKKPRPPSEPPPVAPLSVHDAVGAFVGRLYPSPNSNADAFAYKDNAGEMIAIPLRQLDSGNFADIGQLVVPQHALYFETMNCTGTPHIAINARPLGARYAAMVRLPDNTQQLYVQTQHPQVLATNSILQASGCSAVSFNSEVAPASPIAFDFTEPFMLK